jgi:ADP-ribose pyrophosphatase
VAVTTEQELVLIRQLRYTSADWYWELVAGGYHDFEGDPLDLARRELAEEVGGRSDDWEYVGWFRPGTSMLDEVCHIALARDVHLDLEPEPEAGELIEVHLVPLARGLEMARSGEMVDGHSALSLLRCEHLLRGESSKGERE